MSAAKKSAPKVTMYELVNKRGSGFFLEGTEGTPHAQELDTTTVSWIPASGYRAVFKMDESTGKEIMIYEEIRYIEHQEEIRVSEQEKLKIKPNPKRDKIMFNKGYLTVVREGSMVGLDTYLSDVFYDENAPNRPETAGVIFRRVDLDNKAEELLEDDTHLERALSITNSLKTATGKKDAPWTFNEEKIEAFADLFQIKADTVRSKAWALSKLARATPKAFVELAETFEQKALTEVEQAIQLGVIVWDKNAAILKSENNKSLIVDFGVGNFGKEGKVSKLADFYKSAEGESKLKELQIVFAAAKQKSMD